MKNFAPIFLLILIAGCTHTEKQSSVSEQQTVSNELPQSPHHVKLTWETSPSTSQAVSWRTSDEIKSGTVEYVKATASPFFEVDVRQISAETDTLTSDDRTWAYHQANITGLEPGTTYSYRVGSGDFWSEWSEFTTAIGTDEPFKFIYFGDVQRFIYSKGSRILRQAILNVPDAKFMVFGGDLVHRGAQNIENYGEFFPGGGWIFQNIPTIATPGNHEHDNAKSGIDLSDLWFQNFNFPKNSPEGHEEETYFVDYNNIRVISLNMCRYRYEDDRKEIYDWTKESLEEFEGDWVFITFHYAMDALARNRDAGIRFPEFKALFEQYNVPLILTGHEHLYARGRMDAPFPVYVVSVAGPYQNAIRFADWIERAGTNMQLFQEIEVSPDTLHYYSKTVLGDIYDEFKIVKDGAGKLTFIEGKNLPEESLEPTQDFEDRYDQDLVESYEKDRAEYLNRKRK
ncbi:purple acid phosphatase family protein [Algoriphagus zhangzhouensis]|uniref:Calcineurin-like phosphoesterase n=1 Tax=Algoriphagus zhangzhouensis TaxID=1073327 RepID=A0A1M7ZAX8_9BACT|nr:metallophosphoesterase family protein [Algoriphagus zhangzhouensis]TDY46980.1 calcineurin-like phosphoesterase family protein [Algoriphagus zhangzhouensis]SHO62061.1 Calcineurin-like phosphoesterase [Algoriphagus zhangzhouensis]